MSLHINFICPTGGFDYQPTASTIYFRPDYLPYGEVRIAIFNDFQQEGNEEFTVELKSFDISVKLINDVAKVVIKDDDGKSTFMYVFVYTSKLHFCLQLPNYHK